MRKFFIALLLLLIAGAASAQECRNDVSQANELIFEIKIDSQGNAISNEILTIPFSEECLVEKGLQRLNESKAVCSDIMESFGELNQEFMLASNCTIGFDSNELKVYFSSKGANVVRVQDGKLTAVFGEISIRGLNPQADTTLRVSLPEGFELLDYSPKERSIATSSQVFWMKIPKEPISIQYNAADNGSQQSLIVLAIAIIIAIAILAFGLLFKKRSDFLKKKHLEKSKMQHGKLEELKAPRAKK
ncbi:MAG: hypothetical protein Q7R70_05240 [Candidatus Diapherotrites archaeon]|nr:hypothetical protein [Candidatus Diapherotrites archaeon]